MKKRHRVKILPSDLKLDIYDSSFFNTNIAKLEIDGLGKKPFQPIPDILEWAEKEQIKFLIIKLQNPKDKSTRNILRCGFKICGESTDMRFAAASKPKGLAANIYNIRLARKNDRQAVCDIARDAFRLSYLYGCGFGSRALVDRYHAVWMKNIMNDKGAKVFVAERSSRIVGFLGLSINKVKRCARITLVAVDKRFRGKGIGRALVAEAIEYARGSLKTVFVKTQTNNKKAISLYRKLGFRPLLYDKVFCKKLK
ncbi:MAG: GNAT family N-acetyltransferase [Candidatus Omnitrophota bacterium]